MSRKNKIFLVNFIAGLMLLPPTQTHALIFDLENLRNQDNFLTKAYDKIKIQDAWEFIQKTTPTLSPVTIGVVDTGVDANHQEFNNPKLNFGSSNTPSLRDSNAPLGHGTQVAGIIGANNVLGSAGILGLDSPQMNGIVSGVLKEDKYQIEVANFKTATTTQTSSFFASLEKILKNNPAVLNLSIGAPKCSAISKTRREILGIKECYKTDADFIDAVEQLIKVFDMPENRDTFFIVSAGNWDIDTESSVLPATLDLSNSITIGATDLEDNRATFIPLVGAKSNFGVDIEVSAPGVHVYAPVPANNYDNPRKILGVPVPLTGFEGTSASAPLVTGVAAILKALEPEYKKHDPGLVMTPAKIKEILQLSADPIKTDKPMGSGCFTVEKNPSTGYNGCRLNAHRAVAWLLPPTPVILNTPVAVPVP